MNDGIRRWMTPEGTFRILAARSTAAVSEAARVAGTSPEVTAIYGQLLTGAVLLELAHAPIDRVQCAIVHDGTAGQLLADVWPGPAVRGRVEHPRPDAGPALGPNGVVQVSRQPARGGGLYQGVAAIPGGSVADALQRYVLESEQVLTYFSLACEAGEGGVTLAAGMIVQALPGLEPEHLEAMTRCLEKARFDDLVRAGDDPFDAVTSLFHELSLHELGEDPLTYSCRCSREVAVQVLSTLDEDELTGVRQGRTERVTCEFCGTSYDLGPDDLVA